jgi:hypothetical protein
LYEDAKENAMFDFYKTRKLANFTIFTDEGKEVLYKELKELMDKHKL